MRQLSGATVEINEHTVQSTGHPILSSQDLMLLGSTLPQDRTSCPCSPLPLLALLRVHTHTHMHMHRQRQTETEKQTASLLVIS